MLMPVGTAGSDIGLLLGRTAAMCTRDVLLALSLGAYLDIILARGFLPCTGTEGDAATLDDGIYIISAELVTHLRVCYATAKRGRGLMMKQAHAREGHGNAVLIAGINDMVIAHAASGLCYVLHTALVSTLHIIAEGKESITAQ